MFLPVAYAAMSRPLRPRLSPALHLLVLCLLVFGLVMKPVLAVACEIDDARRVLTDGQPVAAAESEDSDECCPSQNCNECCCPTVAMVPKLKVAASLSLAASPLPALSVEFEPTAYPVALRPPIAT